MQIKKLYLGGLAAFILVFISYGLNRFSLGIDFTDEGAYLAWPMRMLFGEKPFTSELVTLLRPVEVYLALPLKLYPAVTLYEFRMAGWLGHILSFSILSFYLFRLSLAPLQSLLIASLPFFVCHIFGIASPSYNTLSSDFLLIALSLLGLISVPDMQRKIPLGLAAGLALFIATFSHPALGLVGAVMLIHEALIHNLRRNLLRRQLTPSNTGMVAFLACWLAFLIYSIASGALAAWCKRIALSPVSTGTLQEHPLRVFYKIARYPFSYDRLAPVFLLVAFASILTGYIFTRVKRPEYSGRASNLLAFLSVVFLISTFSYTPYYLPICFALVSMTLIALSWITDVAATFPGRREVLFLQLMSGFSAILYAIFTYYFYPHRSWQSGILGFSFAFAVGLTLLLKIKPVRSGPYRFLLLVSLGIAVICVGRSHYREIQRDAAHPELRFAFQIPKLRQIKSTQERVSAIEELYGYLQPRVARGDPLLAFDDCPMLYYLFDAKPAYGLAWAAQRGHSSATLAQLNRELLAKPLPEFAIRNLVVLSNPIWRTSRRIDYDHYPLNETLMANYTLERTIFPFEIWHLKITKALSSVHE